MFADNFLKLLNSLESIHEFEPITSLIRHRQIVELGLEVRLEVCNGFFAHQVDLTDAALVLLGLLQSVQIGLIFCPLDLGVQFGFNEGLTVVAHRELYEQKGPAGPLKEVLLRLLTIFLHGVANHRDVDFSAFHDLNDVFFLVDLGAEHN